jgi:hypothetical protein
LGLRAYRVREGIDKEKRRRTRKRRIKKRRKK